MLCSYIVYELIVIVAYGLLEVRCEQTSTVRPENAAPLQSIEFLCTLRNYEVLFVVHFKNTVQAYHQVAGRSSLRIWIRPCNYTNNSMGL